MKKVLLFLVMVAVCAAIEYVATGKFEGMTTEASLPVAVMLMVIPSYMLTTLVKED